MRALLVNNEKLALLHLKNMLEQQNGVRVAGMFSDANQKKLSGNVLGKFRVSRNPAFQTERGVSLASAKLRSILSFRLRYIFLPERLNWFAYIFSAVYRAGTRLQQRNLAFGNRPFTGWNLRCAITP